MWHQELPTKLQALGTDSNPPTGRPWGPLEELCIANTSWTTSHGSMTSVISLQPCWDLRFPWILIPMPVFFIVPLPYLSQRLICELVFGVPLLDSGSWAWCQELGQHVISPCSNGYPVILASLKKESSRKIIKICINRGSLGKNNGPIFVFFLQLSTLKIYIF